MPYETPNKFDSWRFVQLVRAEIEEETKGMSPGQVVEYYRTYPYDSPHTEIDATRLPWWGSRNEGGSSESGHRSFDSIAYVRWVRAKMTAEREGKLFDQEQDGEIAYGDQA